MPPSNNEVRAWCTLVMIGDTYAAGAAVMCASIRKTQSVYPIWCMVDDSVSDDCQRFLESHFDKVIKVPLIEYQCSPMKSKKQNEIYGSWIGKSFTKWNILNPQVMGDASKICFLDADCIMVENSDDIFDLRTPALTYSSPWARTYVKNKSNTKYSLHDPYGRMVHGQEVPRKLIMRGFNNSFLGLACMVLVKPSQTQWDLFNKILRMEPTYGNSRCVSGHDEQVITETFLATMKPIYHINQRYNCLIGKADTWLERGEQPKLLQWYGEKPWTESQRESDWDDVKLWWSYANAIIETDPESRRWFYQEA
jgi:hypothetical protein